MLTKCGVESIDNNLEYINQYRLNMHPKKSKCLLFVGSTNPAFFKFYEMLKSACDGYELVWMRYKRNYIETFTTGFVIKIPSDINRSNYGSLTEEVELDENEIDEINSVDEFVWTYENIMAVHDNANPNHVRKTILLTKHYFEQVYMILKPDAVFLWNPFVGFNKIAAYVARKSNIPVSYIESGVLPGTMAFSTWGDLGESRPSKEPEFFMNLGVDSNDVEKAKGVLDFLRESGFNRNIQPNDKTRLHIKKNRPVIFLAGQNDTECGLIPYKENEKNSSPSFSNSEDSLYFIADLAKKNDWNLIYKPHPIVARRRLETRPIPVNVNYVLSGNVNDIIDICDVCITILSTTAYISLIRGKPVVMLGKIHLNGQKCTYEAYKKEDIEAEITKALSLGYTEKQKEAFLEHTARMCKYYLFDSYQMRDVCFGRPISEAKEFIDDVMDNKAVF